MVSRPALDPRGQEEALLSGPKGGAGRWPRQDQLAVSEANPFEPGRPRGLGPGGLGVDP